MSLNILLVESAKETRVLMALTLRQRGHRVIEADSIEKARELLETVQFDWVISNCRFPTGTMNGANFLKELLYSRPQLKRLLVSGGGDPGGHDAFFLQKPFKPSKLVDIIEGQAVMH